jgi:hypothetical protein
MVERFAAALGRVDEDPQILARRLLADELVEALRAQRGSASSLVRSGVVMRAGSVAIQASSLRAPRCHGQRPFDFHLQVKLSR